MKNNIFYGTPCIYSFDINRLVTAGRFVLADEGVLLPAPVVVPLVGFLKQYSTMYNFDILGYKCSDRSMELLMPILFRKL